MSDYKGGQEKPLREGREKSGGRSNTTSTPKPNIKPPGQQPEKKEKE